MSYLVDTNVLSELFRIEPNKNVLNWFERAPEPSLYLSVLTIGEIRKRIEKHPDSKRKETIKNWLEYYVPTRFEGRVLPITLEVAERWGRLMSEVARPMPAIDSLFAATALHYDISLVTRNVQNFEYPSLEVINPWE